MGTAEQAPAVGGGYARRAGGAIGIAGLWRHRRPTRPGWSFPHRTNTAGLITAGLFVLAAAGTTGLIPTRARPEA